ncbi:hypothetical protein XELAEV_18003040mg [Xenopus laevis]|nr:hypothetical protein XELAEV_18003040mg [Xenopus laevis]
MAPKQQVQMCSLPYDQVVQGPKHTATVARSGLPSNNVKRLLSAARRNTVFPVHRFSMKDGYFQGERRHSATHRGIEGRTHGLSYTMAPYIRYTYKWQLVCCF